MREFPRVYPAGYWNACPALPRGMGKTAHMASARSGAHARNRMSPRPAARGCGLIYGRAVLCQKGGPAAGIWGAWHRPSGTRPRVCNNLTGARVAMVGVPVSYLVNVVFGLELARNRRATHRRGVRPNPPGAPGESTPAGALCVWRSENGASSKQTSPRRGPVRDLSRLRDTDRASRRGLVRRRSITVRAVCSAALQLLQRAP